MKVLTKREAKDRRRDDVLIKLVAGNYPGCVQELTP
jgi:hypothetical protein